MPFTNKTKRPAVLTIDLFHSSLTLAKYSKGSCTTALRTSLMITTFFESTKIKYLGLLLDSKLSWKFHIHELSKKLSRAIGILYKIRAFSPKPIMRSLYFAIFHSHLAYRLPVWGSANQGLLENIALLQKKLCVSSLHLITMPIHDLS